jgi:hypothetical protein
MKKFVARVAIFLIFGGLIPPLETVPLVQAKLSFFTDNVEAGPVTADTITIDWGSAVHVHGGGLGCINPAGQRHV